MTINGGRPHAVGDRGQRYEVTCKANMALQMLDKVFGWSESLEGARRMVLSIDLSPSLHSPIITDRTTGEVVK